MLICKYLLSEVNIPCARRMFTNSRTPHQAHWYCLHVHCTENKNSLNIGAACIRTYHHSAYCFSPIPLMQAGRTIDTELEFTWVVHEASEQAITTQSDYTSHVIQARMLARRSTTKTLDHWTTSLFCTLGKPAAVNAYTYSIRTGRSPTLPDRSGGVMKERSRFQHV